MSGVLNRRMNIPDQMRQGYQLGFYGLGVLYVNSYTGWCSLCGVTDSVQTYKSKSVKFDSKWNGLKLLLERAL